MNLVISKHHLSNNCTWTRPVLEIGSVPQEYSRNMHLHAEEVVQRNVVNSFILRKCIHWTPFLAIHMCIQFLLPPYHSGKLAQICIPIPNGSMVNVKNQNHLKFTRKQTEVERAIYLRYIFKYLPTYIEE